MEVSLQNDGKIGTHSEFIDIIMACVSSVKYKVRYNDQ